MAKLLFIIGAALFGALGLAHALLALADLRRPRWFTPTNEEARRVMAQTPLRLAPQTTIWRSWMGFNLSHSLGLVLFGGLLGATALQDTGGFAETALRLLSIAGASLYTLLAVRFWFWLPAAVCSLGLLCFLASALAW